MFKNKDIPPLKQTLDNLTEEYDKGIVLKAVTEEGKTTVSGVKIYDTQRKSNEGIL